MNSLTATLLFLLSVTFLSFVKIGDTSSKLKLEKSTIIEILIKQKNGCRPSSEFMFYVETELVKKARGANTINAKIYVLDRASGFSNLLVSENILVSSFKGEVFLQYKTEKNYCGEATLHNGDKIIGTKEKSLYCFNELVKFESIYSSYLKSKNNLLQIKSL